MVFGIIGLASVELLMKYMYRDSRLNFSSQQATGNGHELSATTGWYEDLISPQLSAVLSLNGFFELG